MRLYLTEKPSQIKALQKVIKDDSIFEPLAGHLFSLLNPEEHSDDFKHWYNAVIDEKLPFFPKNFDKRISDTVYYEGKNGQKSQKNYKKLFQAAKKAIDKCDEIVIASDPDDEGASLAMEVIVACGAEHKVKGMMNMAVTDPASLSKSLKEFEENPDAIDYKNMAKASDARAMFDWSFGMNLTMGATVALGDGDVIHMGGVKLPTMRMVVERDLEIENFTPEDYWKIKGVAKDPETGKEFPVTIKYKGNEKVFDENIAKNALDKISKDLTISKYNDEIKKSIPPKPFSLLDMAAEVSRTSGLSMTRSENAAQSLYDKGFLSYPRTEERFYSNGEHKQARYVISGLESNAYFKNLTDLNTPYKKRNSFDDKKLIGKAHGALSPTTRHCDIDMLSHDEKVVYMAVAKRYYAQFMEDYKYKNISIKVEDGDFSISATENIQVSKGWKEMYPGSLDQEQMSLPKVGVGGKLEIISLELEHGMTKPKPRFTELTLAQAMENIVKHYDDPEVQEYLGESGIGRPSTRKKIIQELKADKIGNKTVEPYLSIPGFGDDKGKIVSSQKARDVIDIVPDDISSPILRAELESKTTSIALGNLNLKDFRKDMEVNIKDMYNSILQVGIDKEIRPYNMWNDDERPTKKQVEFVVKMAEYNKLDIPDGLLENKEMLSHWIDKKQKHFRYPITDKQRELLANTKKANIKTLLKQDDFSQDEFVLIQKEIKVQLRENKKTWTYNLSDKQRAILENPDNEVDSKIVDMIQGQDEFIQKDWNKIQKAIKEVFKRPREYKPRDFDR